MVTAEGPAPETLPAPLRMEGLGNGHLAISTKSAEAQAWFDQGLNLLHDFWDYESARAFEQSVRSDPQCAMCFWGLYKAEAFRYGNSAWAKVALGKAQGLAGQATAWERLYIDAAMAEQAKHEAEMKAAASEAASAGKKKAAKKLVAVHVDSEETKVWRRVLALRPEDVQARMFLAESLMDGFDDKGAPKPGTVEGQAMLRQILVEKPEDSAANHYWIHAMEPGLHPEMALESAKKLGGLAPASGHMVHMPGHIFYRTGDYETARRSFEDSIRVDEGYMKAQGVRPENDWNYVHNLMYLIADLLEAGKVAEATAVSAKLGAAHGESGPSLYRQNTRDGMTRLSAELPVALRAAEWQRASAMLEASRPAAEWKNLVGLRGALLEYTQGMAALEAGDVKTAETRSAALDAAVKVAPPQEPPMAVMMMNGSKDAMAKPLHSYLDLAAMELRAALLLAQGQTRAADAEFDRAEKAERELGYHEPPFYLRPVAETRGDAMLRAKRYGEAKRAYETALVERPNSGIRCMELRRRRPGWGTGRALRPRTRG